MQEGLVGKQGRGEDGKAGRVFPAQLTVPTVQMLLCANVCCCPGIKSIIELLECGVTDKQSGFRLTRQWLHECLPTHQSVQTASMCPIEDVTLPNVTTKNEVLLSTPRCMYRHVALATCKQ